MDTAVAGGELLRVLDVDGDDFSIPRDVEFLLRGVSAEKASIVASFVNDHQYGRASLDQSGEIYRVLLLIDMPRRGRRRGTQTSGCRVRHLAACAAEGQHPEHKEPAKKPPIMRSTMNVRDDNLGKSPLYGPAWRAGRRA